MLNQNDSSEGDVWQISTLATWQPYTGVMYMNFLVLSAFKFILVLTTFPATTTAKPMKATWTP